MPTVTDGIVRITASGGLSDGLCLRKEHLPRLLTELRDVQRQDYDRDRGQNNFESGASLNVRGAIEEDKQRPMSCRACGDQCKRRSIIMYTFPNGNTAQSVSYCRSCTEDLVNRVETYIDGREDELLGDLV